MCDIVFSGVTCCYSRGKADVLRVTTKIDLVVIASIRARIFDTICPCLLSGFVYVHEVMLLCFPGFLTHLGLTGAGVAV